MSWQDGYQQSLQPDAPAVPPPVGAYKEGDRVEGDFKGKGVWYPGAITCNRYTHAHIDRHTMSYIDMQIDIQAHTDTHTCR